MKLSEVDKRVIAAVRLHADRSVQELSQSTGVRPHVLRRSLEKLRAARVLIPYLIVNPYTLGFTDYGVYLKLSTDGRRNRRKLLDYLVRSPMVPWVAEMMGPYEVAYSLIARSTHEVHKFFGTLAQALGEYLVEKSICARVQWENVTPGFIRGAHCAPEPVIGGGGNPCFQPDALDLKILRQLSDHPEQASSVSARKLGIVASTHDYRISRMKEVGVIVGSAYYLNASVCGLTAGNVIIQERGELPILHEKFRRFCLQHRNVECVMQNIGTWSFEIALMAEDPRAFLDFVDQISEAFPHFIASTEILTLIQTHKLVQFPGGLLQA